MNHEKLYKRTSTGAVQVWWQERTGGKFRTHSGQDGGKIVTSEWTLAEGKNVGRSNETTPEAQAKLEVESNYARKKKDGYSETVQAAKDSNRFSPMLAKDFDEYGPKINFAPQYPHLPPVYAQPKLDGIRCIANAQGLWARKGDPIVSCPHIFKVLKPFFEAMPGLMLDGELYNHDLHDDFDEITSLVKKPTAGPEHWAVTEKIIEYHIYDSPDGGSLYHTRFARFADIVNAVGAPLVIVPTMPIFARHALDTWYEEWLNKGYEGQIVRVDGPYEQKRTKLLLKRKEFVDSEFEVLDILEGKGNASGGAKIAWLRLDTNPDEKFKADVVGTKAQRVEILKNKAKLIGKMATVKYFKQRTPAGIPRFGKIKLIHDTPRW